MLRVHEIHNSSIQVKGALIHTSSSQLNSTECPKEVFPRWHKITIIDLQNHKHHYFSLLITTVLLPAGCCQHSPMFYAVSHCFAQHPESCWMLQLSSWLSHSRSQFSRSASPFLQWEYTITTHNIIQIVHKSTKILLYKTLCQK